MTFKELITKLEPHLSDPQPSERWAMYRLIMPVVDFANQSPGHLPYFEYNQTSSHGTHQSIDIALLDNQLQPRILIEAKRPNRKVSPEQIAKYLETDDPGIVTNGYIWILCQQGVHEAIRVFDDRINPKALKKVISFIQGSIDIDNAISNNTNSVYNNEQAPNRIVNKTKIFRPRHPVELVNSAKEFASFIQNLENNPINERVLLESICSVWKSSPNPDNLEIKARKTRVSFFDDHLSRNEKRLARIELGKSQPDILLRTLIVDKYPELTSLAKPTMHDKGAHMRRFRLSTEHQAEDFGKQLMKILQQEARKSTDMEGN